MRIDKTRICIKPFTTIEISPSGDVYTCCPFHLSKYSLGNINDSSIDEIWFSKRAVDIRNKILNHDYSLCEEKNCVDFCAAHGYGDDETVALKFLENEKFMYPVFLKYVFDEECNVQCIYCRDKITKNSKEDIKRIESYVNKLSVVIENSKVIYSSGSGDPFTGGYAEQFLKKVSERSPNTKFEIHTNGILCTKNKIEYLNIDKKIYSIIISLPGATKQTYDSIVKYGNFYKVIENIEYLNSLRSPSEHFAINLNFVVCSLNYHEIVSFAQLAEKYNANAYFWEVQNWNMNVEDEFKKIAISNMPEENLHELKKLLNHEIIQKPFVILNPYLNNIRESSSNRLAFVNE